MILIQKNVYKYVWSFENVFKFCKMFEGVCDYFENIKDVCFEMEQVIRRNLPTQMSFLFILFSFYIVVLPFIW